MRRPLSWRGWRTRPWTTLLRGTTLPALTLALGAERWIASWRASRASPSASPEPVAPKPTNDGSGLRSRDAFAIWSPSESSWRMSQASFLPESEMYSGTWPRWGSMRNGACSQRRPWAPLIAANASSSWPTPTARDWKDDGSAEANVPTNGLLGRTVARWQTPQTDSFRSRGGERKDEAGLDRQARTWPTPTASVAQDGEHVETWDARRVLIKERKMNGNGMGEPLTIAASRFGRPSPETPPDGTAISPPVVLNPPFVEALMGLPRGWSGCEPLAMELSPWLRRWRIALSALVS